MHTVSCKTIRHIFSRTLIIKGERTQGESWNNIWRFLVVLRNVTVVTVVLVNPLHTHKLKEVDDHTPSKNDAKDAGIIARAVAEGRYMHRTPREGVWSELATLSVTRRQQKADVVRWQNRIQGWLDVYAPEFRQVFKAWKGLAALWVLDTVGTTASCTEDDSGVDPVTPW
ncbi:IS110 family transposase [Sulfobacillus thermotolerans]|uniref:IS110 family transposase n=1 Tax=Sulfobacillus thermotolerans TaxID=338644 RepID=UPI003367D141